MEEWDQVLVTLCISLLLAADSIQSYVFSAVGIVYLLCFDLL